MLRERKGVNFFLCNKREDLFVEAGEVVWFQEPVLVTYCDGISLGGIGSSRATVFKLVRTRCLRCFFIVDAVDCVWFCDCRGVSVALNPKLKKSLSEIMLWGLGGQESSYFIRIKELSHFFSVQ